MANVQDGADATRALEILLDDVMMRNIARNRRYRVLANQPVAGEAGRKLRGIDLVDYATDRAVTARVDLDRGGVASLLCAPAGPQLAAVEEDEALAVALADRRVAEGLLLGDRPQRIVHVGTGHRSAAITFGAPRGAPSLVAVVDLARGTVTKILPGSAG